MWKLRKINYITRIVECEDSGFRFDILFFDNLVITDNVVYNSVEECIIAQCEYLKKLSAHSLSEPFVVNL